MYRALELPKTVEVVSLNRINAKIAYFIFDIGSRISAGCRIHVVYRAICDLILDVIHENVEKSLPVLGLYLYAS